MKRTVLIVPGVILLVLLGFTTCHKSPANNSPDDPFCPIGPSSATIGYPSVYSTFTIDPDGDSIAYRFTWGDGDTTPWSTYTPCGATLAMSHGWNDLGSYHVEAQATDRSGAVSEWSKPATVAIAGTREVRWNWTGSGGVTSSPLLVFDGTEHLVVFCAEDSLYTLGLDGTARDGTDPVSGDDGIFIGQPGFCAATGHIIIGGDDGELCAFTTSLERDWHWPGNSLPGPFDELEWGAPAIRENRIYVPRWDSIAMTRVYYFLDLGNEACLMNTYALPDEELSDAPVVDPDGNVLFCTDYGNLYKLGPELDTVIWCVRIMDGMLLGPAIGQDGTIYLGSTEGYVIAVSPAGDIEWLTYLGDWTSRPAIGSDAVFVGDGDGDLYAISPTDGEIIWSVTLDTPYSPIIAACPVLAANGLMYVLGDEDILFCINQSDGCMLWYCICDEFAGSGRDEFDDFEPSPTIAPNGDIIVPVWDDDNLCCVVGYPEGTLADTPWPKWQRDLHNSGSAGSW